MYTCSFSWNPVIEYAVATDNPYSFVLSLPPGYHNFMSTTNNNDIYFLSTPHCLTLICISNFHTDNWSQTSFCRLPYGKEQLNTNQKKSWVNILISHFLFKSRRKNFPQQSLHGQKYLWRSNPHQSSRYIKFMELDTLRIRYFFSCP